MSNSHFNFAFSSFKSQFVIWSQRVGRRWRRPHTSSTRSTYNVYSPRFLVILYLFQKKVFGQNYFHTGSYSLKTVNTATFLLFHWIYNLLWNACFRGETEETFFFKHNSPYRNFVLCTHIPLKKYFFFPKKDERFFSVF